MTPKMIPGTVEMVAVEWIMQNATGSVDGYGTTDEDWNDVVDYDWMIQSKAADYDFPELVNTIVTRGFRVPIVLCLDYEVTGDIVHGNGHHRMCAAILLCLDDIPVYWSNTSDYMVTESSDTEEIMSDSGDFAGVADLLYA